MKQSGQKDVHVAVPEAGSHDEALAVDYGRTAWNSDGCAWPYCNNVAVAYENRAVLDCRLCGGGIDSGPNQSKIGGTGSATRREDPKNQKWVQQTASHSGNIRSRRRGSSVIFSSVPSPRIGFRSRPEHALVRCALRRSLIRRIVVSVMMMRVASDVVVQMLRIH